MKTVGTQEARSNLSKLLARVASGERITITNRGRPVAMLGPPPEEVQPRSEDVCSHNAHVVEELLSWRDRGGPKLDTATLRELMEEGRR